MAYLFEVVIFIKCLPIIKGKKMARSDWFYPNIEKGLMAEADKVIETAQEHGVQKYKDRKDFIVKAIKAQLDKELGKEVCLQ